MPKMPFMGVRISWLMRAMKSALAWPIARAFSAMDLRSALSAFSSVWSIIMLNSRVSSPTRMICAVNAPSRIRPSLVRVGISPSQVGCVSEIRPMRAARSCEESNRPSCAAVLPITSDRENP